MEDEELAASGLELAVQHPFGQVRSRRAKQAMQTPPEPTEQLSKNVP